MAYLAMSQLRHTAAAKEDTLLHKTLQEQERQKEQGYGWLKGIQKWKILPEANRTNNAADSEGWKKLQTKAIRTRMQENFKILHWDIVKSTSTEGTHGKLAFLYNTGSQFKPQQYTRKLFPSQAQVIFNFRMSNHTLPVERMQYGREKIHYPERKCEHGCQDIGSEEHLFNCPQHENMIAAVKARAGISGNGRIDHEQIQELMDNPSTALVKLLMTTWKPIAGIG